jgi:diaminopimelate decarboxylase
LKANGLPGLVERIARAGFGANAVSRGELALASRAGMPPRRTALEGIGKSPADLRAVADLAAGGRPLLWTSLESAEDAAALAALAGSRLGPRRRLDVLVRVNPSVQPETHAGLAVGRATSKFGLAERELPGVFEAGGGARGPLRWRGIHVHAGSQLESVRAWADAVGSALRAFIVHAPGHDRFDTLDVGGGFPSGIPEAPRLEDFARAARRALLEIPAGARPSRLAIEPGRAVVAGCGWLVGRVLHVRRRGGIRQVVIDAGMSELVRPALYGAEHPVYALTSMGRPVDPSPAGEDAILEGPICESTDRVGTPALPPVERGDVLAIGMAGAYASAMFTTYNGRARPPEVLLERAGSRRVLRRRGAIGSLP